MTSALQAVGYIRVSTQKQNEGDHALEGQAERIRRFCADRGIKLISICEDTCSAVDVLSVERRPSLTEVVQRAAREGACLMVPEPTRLFRNVEVADRWLKSVSVPIFSVKHGKILTPTELLEAISVGENVAQATRDGTSGALGKKRAAGVKLGSKADRTAANEASKLARSQTSNALVDTIARIILEDPAYRDLSHRAFADLLNRRHVLTGWSRPWTEAGVKRQRVLARQRIAEWESIAGDEVSPDEVSLPPAEPQPVRAPAPLDDEEKMKALPTYGLF